jgi:hypothetical protein
VSAAIGWWPFAPASILPPFGGAGVVADQHIGRVLVGHADVGGARLGHELRAEVLVAGQDGHATGRGVLGGRAAGRGVLAGEQLVGIERHERLVAVGRLVGSPFADLVICCHLMLPLVLPAQRPYGGRA